MKVLCSYNAGSLCFSDKRYSYFYVQSTFHDISQRQSIGKNLLGHKNICHVHFYKSLP
jgi:hypothetical protein